jgi:hypothetical protein
MLSALTSHLTPHAQIFLFKTQLLQAVITVASWSLDTHVVKPKLRLLSKTMSLIQATVLEVDSSLTLFLKIQPLAWKEVTSVLTIT